MGWPPLAAITWASPIAPLSIPLILALNLVMLALNVTRTVNIDIWNYWHFSLVGALVQAASGSLLLGLAVTAVIAVYGIIVADWNAPLVEKECGLKGISITTLSVNGMLPYAVAADQLIERIPGLRRISLSPRDTGSRFGILVEPMLIGVAIGRAVRHPGRLRGEADPGAGHQRGCRDVHPAPLRRADREGHGARVRSS